MIPQGFSLLEDENTSEGGNSQTFFIDFDEEKMGGYINDLAAIRQAVSCILNTERYQHEIYSWDYGVELFDVVGMDTDTALPEIEKRITEALLQDDRISEVFDFQFEVGRGKVNCFFCVRTAFGQLNIEQEVLI